MRAILISLLSVAFLSSAVAADFTRGTGSATSSVKMFRGNGTTAEEVSLYRGNGTTAELIVAPSSTCNGTHSILTGDIEIFENGTGAFCTSEFSVPANTDGGVVSTFSTNSGTLISTHSLEIFDTSAGNHRNDAVRVDLGEIENDNNWSIRFKYKIESGPVAYSGISFMSGTESATDTQTNQGFSFIVGGNTGSTGSGPFRLQITGSDNSAHVRTALAAGTTVCIFIDINAYTGSGDTSTITVYDSDCSSNGSTSTFEISNRTIRYLWFGGINDDNDPHHFGIDDIEFNADGGAF